jgi:hypothetical protein
MTPSISHKAPSVGRTADATCLFVVLRATHAVLRSILAAVPDLGS